MKRIAIVNQRYGLEVNGGSEYYTRLIAEKLKDSYDVEVLTTTALNHVTWENYYSKGIQDVNGVTVRRFEIDKKRNIRVFNIVSRIMRYVNLFTNRLQKNWVNLQGPLSTECIEYIRDNNDKYDAFIFVTYLYYLTVMGLPSVKDKSILIPTAHDEFCIYFDIYNKIFKIPKAIIYLTEEEKFFVQNTFHNENIINDTIGVGIDIPAIVDGKQFCMKYKIVEPYIIYVGRIESAKGCDILFNHFIKYKNEYKDCKLKLVLAGKSTISIPERLDIVEVGFISEEDKFNGMAGAKALILPSKFESLSIAVLESMAVGTPVIVNEECEVLKGHCTKSGGGLYYKDYEGFKKNIDVVLAGIDDNYELRSNAKKYIDSNYKWKSVLERFKKIIESI